MTFPPAIYNSRNYKGLFIRKSDTKSDTSTIVEIIRDYLSCRVIKTTYTSTIVEITRDYSSPCIVYYHKNQVESGDTNGISAQKII